MILKELGDERHFVLVNDEHPVRRLYQRSGVHPISKELVRAVDSTGAITYFDDSVEIIWVRI